VSTERVSTGVTRLDAMLGDGGFYRGSTVLVSGGAGTGKSTLAAQFCNETCSRGERAMYFAFEESEAEIVRNMASVGIDLRRWVVAGLLQFHCFRPKPARDRGAPLRHAEVRPRVRAGRRGQGPGVKRSARGHGDRRRVDVDPSGGLPEGARRDALLTSLSSGADPSQADEQLEALVDTWLEVKSMEGDGELNRILYVLKSRGMAHSNQIREFLLTSQGVELADVYVGPAGVLTGSARQAQEAEERSDATARQHDLEQRQVDLATRRESVEAQTAVLWREFEDEADIVRRLLSDGSTGVEDLAGQRAEQGRLRRVDTDEAEPTAPADAAPGT
jgi:circadian clock protein KaiC